MLDTSSDAARVQEGVLRRLPPVQRIRLAIGMSITARMLARVRLRKEHPEWDEARIHAEMLRKLLPPGHPAAP